MCKISFFFIKISYTFYKKNFKNPISEETNSLNKKNIILNIYTNISTKVVISGTVLFTISLLISLIFLFIISLYSSKNCNLEILLNNYLLKEILTVIFFIILINIIHTLIAFYSIGYDYLLKKLTSKNEIVLYFITSTTLYIFCNIFMITICF